MLSERYIKIIIDIINKYGKTSQVLQSIEEMSELIKELLKNINRNIDNKKEITLEIADVIIMLMQLMLIYGIEPEKVLGGIEYKLERQKKRMENENTDIFVPTKEGMEAAKKRFEERIKKGTTKNYYEYAKQLNSDINKLIVKRRTRQRNLCASSKTRRNKYG